MFAAILAAGALTLAPAPAAAQTPTKFAVIDVRRAVLETEQGLRVQAQLKKLFDSRQVELEAKQRQLQADKETLEKEQGKIPKEQFQKKYEKLLQLDADIQRAVVEAQREMQRKEQELTTPILQGVLEAVKRIAAQEGYEMVLEKSAVPFFRADLELTDRAIQLYNGGTAKPATPATPQKGAPAAPPAAPQKAAQPGTPAAPPAPKK